MVLITMCLVLVYVLVVFKEYGVTTENHHVFVKVLRMRRNKATTEQIGLYLCGYVLCELQDKENHLIDMAPVDMFDSHDYDEIMTIVIKHLLDSDIKPVSIDRSGSHTVLMVGKIK